MGLSRPTGSKRASLQILFVPTGWVPPFEKGGPGGIRFCSSSRAKAKRKRIPRAVAFRVLTLRRALAPFCKVGTGLPASFEAKWTLRAISNEFSFELGWPGIRFLLKPSGSKKQKRIPRAVAFRILRLRRALAPFYKVGAGLLASFEAKRTLRAISNEFSFEIRWPGIRFPPEAERKKKAKANPHAVAFHVLRLRRALASFYKVGTGLLASLFEARADSLGSPKCVLLIAKVRAGLLALFEEGCAHPI